MAKHFPEGPPKTPPFCKEVEGKNIFQDIPDFAILPEVLKSETTSAANKGSARGCAKLASILANKGEDLISNKAWTEMHSEPLREIMFQFPGSPIRSNFTKGGVYYFEKYEDEKFSEELFNGNHYGYYGWKGYGGSIMQWNPELKIGFAFVPTFLNQVTDPSNKRGGLLQKLVVECLKQN